MCRFDEAMAKHGAGKPGFMTIATSAIVKGLKLDPVPLQTHNQVIKNLTQEEMIGLVRRFREGEISYESLRSSLEGSVYRGLVRSYVMGTRSVKPDAELSDYDFDKIQDLFSKQRNYLRNFMADMVLDTGKMPYERRAAMYASSLDNAFYSGSFSRMSNEVLIYWNLNPAEHCEDCIDMSKDSPYTPDELSAKTPRSGSTRCLGNCKCSLEVTTRAKRLARTMLGSSAKL